MEKMISIFPVHIAARVSMSLPLPAKDWTQEYESELATIFETSLELGATVWMRTL